MSAKLLKIDGSVLDIEPKDGKSFTLEELYELIECDTIEVIRIPHDKLMIVDEEGKFKKNPTINIAATSLMDARPDVIVGNAVVCDKNQFK